jgi:hypothetical protein
MLEIRRNGYSQRHTKSYKQHHRRPDARRRMTWFCYFCAPPGGRIRILPIDNVTSDNFTPLNTTHCLLDMLRKHKNGQQIDKT